MSRKVADISFQVVRSRRRTADVIIERDGSVQVRAPTWVNDDQIAEVVEAKRRWIYQNLAEWRCLNATRVLREYKNGEGFLYLGRAYRLQLVSDQVEKLLLKNGRFCLRRDLVDAGGIDLARAAFQAFYSERGRERIRERVKYFAPKVGENPRAIEVRELGHRWAACSAERSLAFHWKCMMAPPTVLDYIVVHELCHFHHFDHTDLFWNEVDKVLPNFCERKEWLRKYGAGMDV